MENFKGKLAVITGAGTGMGYELAIQLASEGCNMAIRALNETDAEAIFALHAN